MHRRRYLAAVAGAGIAGLAGCGGSSSGTGDGTTVTTEGSGDGISLPVAESDLNRGAREDAIPAITDPAFAADWSSVVEDLAPEDRVLGLEREGEARAYPISVLNWHEIVNETFGGPLLVTFCPLCGSGMTAERRVDGSATTFGVSGLLWRSNLVMYDEATDSLWSQILAKSIRGPRTGTPLSLVPSTLTTWAAWREAHPETSVMLPPPESETIVDNGVRDYSRNPYAAYEDNRRIGIGYNDLEDDRLHPKTEIIAVASGDVTRAYPLPTVEQEDVISDVVGDLPVVVTVDAGDGLVAYERRVGGEVLDVAAADEGHLSADGSRWERATGRAVDGPHEGSRLERANDHSPLFWFSWVDVHPGTEIYGRSDSG